MCWHDEHGVYPFALCHGQNVSQSEYASSLNVGLDWNSNALLPNYHIKALEKLKWRSRVQQRVLGAIMSQSWWCWVLFFLSPWGSPSNKAQVIGFLLTCDTRVLVFTFLDSSHQHVERAEYRREKEEKENSHQQLSFFSVAAQISINPQRLNRWIVSIFGQQLHRIWANILDGWICLK